MSISNGWFAVSVYRCLERGIPPLLVGTSRVVRAWLQESFSSAILLENPAQAQQRRKKKKEGKFVQILLAEVRTSEQTLATDRSCKLPLTVSHRLYSKQFDVGTPQRVAVLLRMKESCCQVVGL